VIYLSFKPGTEERVKDGRLFTGFAEVSLSDFIGTYPEVAILRILQTADLRPGRSGERWVNALLRRLTTTLVVVCVP